MPEHIRYEDDHLFNPETQHEHSDVPVRPLFWFVIVFVVFAVLSHVALLILYKAFARAERRRMDPPQTQVARPKDADVPQNQPLLQPFPKPNTPPQRDTPEADMAEMLREQTQVLNSYGWIDRQHGVVHIPIEEAKRMLAARAAVAGQLAPAPSPATSPAQQPAEARPSGEHE